MNFVGRTKANAIAQAISSEVCLIGCDVVASCLLENMLFSIPPILSMGTHTYFSLSGVEMFKN